MNGIPTKIEKFALKEASQMLREKIAQVILLGMHHARDDAAYKKRKPGLSRRIIQQAIEETGFDIDILRLKETEAEDSPNKSEENHLWINFFKRTKT